MDPAEKPSNYSDVVEHLAPLAHDLAVLLVQALVPTLAAQLGPSIAKQSRGAPPDIRGAEILTPKDVEREYHISRRTIYNARSLGSTVPFKKTCGRLRARRDEIEAWLDGRSAVREQADVERRTQAS